MAKCKHCQNWIILSDGCKLALLGKKCNFETRYTAPPKDKKRGTPKGKPGTGGAVQHTD